MTDHDAQHGTPDGQKRAELESLFRRWDAGDAALDPDEREAHARVLSGGIKTRLIISVLLLCIAGFFMYLTRHGFTYWLQSTDPIELGDLRERWIEGERELSVSSNVHASAEGMVITRRRTATGPDGEDMGRVFFCPLYGIVVKTDRELPRAERQLWVEIDARYQDIVAEKLAWPEDLAVSFEARGRLVAAEDAPPNAAAAVGYYANRLDRDPSEMWVLFDGDVPEGYNIFAIVWLCAALVPLVSLAFLLRAMRRRRRALEALETGGIE